MTPWTSRDFKKVISSGGRCLFFNRDGDIKDIITDVMSFMLTAGEYMRLSVDDEFILLGAARQEIIELRAKLEKEQ